MRYNDLLETVLAMRGDDTGAAVTRWRQCLDLLAQMPADAFDSQGTDRLLGSLEAVRQQVPLDRRVSSVEELGGLIRSPVLVRFLANDHSSVVSATMRQARLPDREWAAVIPLVGPLARSILRQRKDMGPQGQSTLALFGTTDLALEADRASSAPVIADRAEAPPEGGRHFPFIVEALPVIVDAAPAEPEVASPELASNVLELPISAVLKARALRGAEETPLDALPAHKEAGSEISRIVDRIEQFRSRREAAPVTQKDPKIVISRFQFEADENGMIRSVSNAPRGAAVGLSIGVPALDGQSGADGHAIGAFRNRAPLRGARYVIGSGHLAGEWRITASPRFSPLDGSFLGYSGEARRALAYELVVRGPAGEAEGLDALSPSTTRQLVHELRTPLNAVQGFAEIIEQQLLGPVSDHYRTMATSILRDARQLIATFDDLDLASRLLRGDSVTRASQCLVSVMIDRAVGPFRHNFDGSPAILVDIPDKSLAVEIDATLAERLFMHLFRAFAAVREAGETLAVKAIPAASGNMVNIRLGVPAALKGWTEEDFYREGAEIANAEKDGPPLGTAFSLRLVRTLAESCQGRFSLKDGQCLLALPLAGDAAIAPRDRHHGA